MKARKIGLVAGPLAFALMLLLPLPAGMSPAGARTAAVAFLMVIWWITEAIPIPATSLIPLVAFPWLGIMDGKQAALNYGDHNIGQDVQNRLMARRDRCRVDNNPGLHPGQAGISVSRFRTKEAPE